MEKEKNCRNCRHYLIHYVKTSNGYQDTLFGHCGYSAKRIRRLKFCEHWEEPKNEIPLLEKSLTSRIETLTKCIDQIYLILELMKESAERF